MKKKNKNTVKYSLNALVKITNWSWEKTAREMSLVIGYDGVTHTTLWRVSASKHTPNTLTSQYIRKAIEIIVSKKVRDKTMTMKDCTSIMTMLPRVDEL